ncbi:MAG TPA: hypothetical protein VMC79_01355 [Rectinemataceae bacterium]|nr:hypothetical protein [Rectinemataceae bacterium]
MSRRPTAPGFPMAIGALLAFALLSAPLLASQAAGDGQGLRFEGSPFLNYAINRAVIESEESFEGPAFIDGLRWDGGRVRLFEARVAQRSRSLDAAFYCDESLRSLEISVRVDGRPRRIEYDLSQLAEPDPRLRSLIPPLVVAGSDPNPAHLVIQSSSLEGAGAAAASVFLRSAPRRAWPALAAALLAACIATMLPRTASRRGRVALLLPVIASLAATLLVAFQASEPPILFVAMLPSSGGGAPVSGALDRRVEDHAGYSVLRYASGQGEPGGREAGPASGADSVAVIGISAPLPPGIPLAVIDGVGRSLRLSSPPLVSSREGSLTLSSPEMVTGWVLHGKD